MSISIAALGFLCLSVVPQASPTCTTLHLEATLEDDLRHVRGTLHCRVAESAELRAARYPKLLRTPDSLDDVNQLWYYPDGFDAADMHVCLAPQPSGHRPKPAPHDACDAAYDTAYGNALFVPLGHVEKGDTLAVHFVTTLPNRQGVLGVRHNVAYLMGGWYPQLSRVPSRKAGDDGASSPSIDAARITYRVSGPKGRAGFVGQTPFGLTSPDVQTGSFDAGSLPWLSAPSVKVTTAPGFVLLVPQNGAGQAPDGGDISDSRNVSAERDIEATLAQGVDLGRRLGLERPPLIAVVTPTRAELAEPFAGGLAISDRAFHVLPFERVKKFHRASIWREQMAQSVYALAQKTETRMAPIVAADAVAVGLTQVLLRQYGAQEYVPDVLEKFAVTPEVDNLIFAPQAPFVESYYRALDDRATTRLRLDTYDEEGPRGGLLYAKLEDWAGPQSAQTLALAYTKGGQGWLERVALGLGEPIAQAQQAWLQDYPRIDYVLDVVHSEARTTDIEISVQGPDAPGIVEPLDVEVTDACNMKHTSRRLGPGPLHWDVPGPVRTVQIDPANHLLQLAHDKGEGPRFNDGTPHRFRLLLNDVGGVIAATNLQITAFADASLRRLHDLRYSGLFGVAVSPYTFNASAFAIRNFGAELTPLRLSQSVSLGLNYAYLRPGDGAVRTGNQVSLTFAYLYDNRLSRFASFSGQGLAAQGTAGVTVLPHGATEPFYTVGAAAMHIAPLAFGHALLGRLRGDITFGSVPEQSQLRLGGRYLGARGYESDEQTAKRRAIASLEYRHVLWGAGRTDIVGAIHGTRLDGAFFADAVWLPDGQPKCAHAMFYDVGYGVRFMAEIFNVSPVSLEIDVGIPLNRCADQKNRVPFTIYLAFVQSFFAF